MFVGFFFFFFKQKTAYEIGVRLVGSEMCIRDRIHRETEHGIELRRRLNCCADTAWSAIFCVSSPNGWPKKRSAYISP